MPISFTPVRRYPVQLTTTKTSAAHLPNTSGQSIVALTKKYIYDVQNQIRQSQDKLYASRRTIGSDAHRVWGKKIEAICPKYTYTSPLPGWDRDGLPSSCKNANFLPIKDGSGRGGIFCATKANDQDKQECMNNTIPSIYTVEQDKTFRQMDEKDNALDKDDKFFQYTTSQILDFAKKHQI
jgi:hypothetical protein